MSEPVVVDPEQVADLLEAAADYIDVHGWCQHGFIDSDGRVCMIGAIRRVLGASELCLILNDATFNWGLYDPTENALVTTLRGAPTSFNDHPGREAWEVDELLRTTAKKVRHGDLSVG